MGTTCSSWPTRRVPVPLHNTLAVPTFMVWASKARSSWELTLISVAVVAAGVAVPEPAVAVTHPSERRPVAGVELRAPPMQPLVRRASMLRPLRFEDQVVHCRIRGWAQRNRDKSWQDLLPGAGTVKCGFPPAHF